MPHSKISSLFFTTPKHVPIVEKAWEVYEVQNYLHHLKVHREEYRAEKVEVHELISERKTNLKIIEERIELYRLKATQERCEMDRWVVQLNKVLEAKNGKLPILDPELPLTERHLKLFKLVVANPNSKHRATVEKLKNQYIDRRDKSSSQQKLDYYLEQKKINLEATADYKRQIKLADEKITELNSEILSKELEVEVKSFFFKQNIAASDSKGNSAQQDCAKEKYFKFPQYR